MSSSNSLPRRSTLHHPPCLPPPPTPTPKEYLKTNVSLKTFAQNVSLKTFAPNGSLKTFRSKRYWDRNPIQFL